MSVPYGHLLSCLVPRTDYRSGYRKNTGSILSKFYIHGWSKHFKSFNKKHTKFVHSPSVPIISPKNTCFFLQWFAQKIVSGLSANSICLKKTCKHDNTQHDRISKRKQLLSLKRTIWRRKRDLLSSGNGFAIINFSSPPIFNFLA